MTTPHRATPEQWASIEAGIRTYPGQWPGQWGDCVLELRARVEALEATQHAHAERQDQPTSSRKRPITTDEELYRVWDASPNVAVALRAVYNLGRQRGAAQTTCPHIVSSDEGTSYCRLAEQSATPATPMTELRAASAKARSGGLVERLMEQGYGKTHARAAIRIVAAWLRTGRLLHAAELLEQEADR